MLNVRGPRSPPLGPNLLSIEQLNAIHFYILGLSKSAACKKAHAPVNTFKEPYVNWEIDRRKELLKLKHILNEEWIVKQLMDIAGASIGDMIVIGDDGKPFLDWSLFNDSVRNSITHFDEEEYMKDKRPTRKVKIRMADKLRALQMLGNTLGMFKEKVELSADSELIRKLQEGRERISQEPCSSASNTEEK